MAEPILATQAATAQPVDRDLFSLHPEEQMTEHPSHRLQGNYIARAQRRLLRGWFVAANLGVYWVPGQMEHPYAGPDVLVARGRPAREDSAVYLTYEDGPLTLVVEVASPATRSLDLQKRDTDYAVALAVPWYLWIDLPRRVLELYRLVLQRRVCRSRLLAPHDMTGAGRTSKRRSCGASKRKATSRRCNTSVLGLAGLRRG